MEDGDLVFPEEILETPLESTPLTSSSSSSSAPSSPLPSPAASSSSPSLFRVPSSPLVPSSSQFRQPAQGDKFALLDRSRLIRPWELSDSLIGGRFVPCFRDLRLPFDLELLRTRVQSEGCSSGTLFGQLAQLREASHNISFFSLWCSFAMTSALEKILGGWCFNEVGSRVTAAALSDYPSAADPTKALLHYFYLVLSEVVVGVCVHPLNVVNTYRAINVTDVSIREAYREVKLRKSPFDGVSSRIAHSIVHRVTADFLWSAIAIHLSPARFLENAPLPTANPQNERVYRRELADRAVKRWRQRVWFSFLRSVAGSAASVMCLPLSFVRSKIESQGLSYKTTDILYSGFFDALSHCIGWSSRTTPFFAPGTVATCIKAEGYSLAIDSAASFVSFLAGMFGIFGLESWAPLPVLEFIAL